MNIPQTLPTALLAILAGITDASDAREPAPQPEVLVSATRSPTDPARLNATAISIGRLAIERSQARDLYELLRAEAGLDFARTGGPGGSTSLFVRGTNSNHVLVLIDGVRVAATGTGAAALEHLPLEQIERVELVRGPRAAWWGSDALGGVLQIFTRRTTGHEVALRTGNNDVFGASLRSGVSSPGGAWSASLERTGSGGFSAQNPLGFGYDPDEDPYYSRRAALTASLPLGEAIALDTQWLATDNDIAFDRGRSRQRLQNGGLSLSQQLSADWQQELRLGGAREDLETPAFDASFRTRRHQLDWSHRYRLAVGLELDGGYSLVDERGRSGSLSGGADSYRESRQRHSLWLGLRQPTGVWTWGAALRHDDDEGYGSDLTASADLGLALGDWGHGWLAWGEGYRAPNFNELYSPGFGGLFAGNPALAPERSRTLEAGVRGTIDTATRWQVAAYRSRIQGLISFAGPDFQAINIARAAIDGVEAELGWQGAQRSARLNLTLADPRNADTGARLLRRAREQLSGSVEQRLAEGRAGLGLELQWVGHRRDVGGARLDAYTLLALRADWQFSDALTLEAKLENALDADPVLVRGFNSTPRQFVLGLRWRAD
ncbi:MAG: TonB-dependent receptor [Xanthomonadales bacterium]|jgi:vitamin B12 transporter|nr:TonB-dependent receptor [Xanthomonadales bacterium]